MRFNPYNHIVFLVGMKDAGKSYYGDFLITGLTRKIIYDRNWEHTDKGYVCNTVEQVKKAWLFDDLTSIVFQPLRYTDEEFDQLSRFVLWNCVNVCYYVEETELQAHARGYTSQAFNEIVNRGKHMGIGLICASRRPHIIHKDIRGNADFVILFQLQEEDDVKYMARWLGISEDDIRNLPEYHSFLYERRGRKVVRQLPC